MIDQQVLVLVLVLLLVLKQKYRHGESNLLHCTWHRFVQLDFQSWLSV